MSNEFVNLDDETLLFQLVNDLQEVFDADEEYSDVTVKKSMDGDYNITYPLVVVRELDNADENRFFDGQEHIVNVGYQIEVLADQSETKDAETNVRCIQNIIRDYMRGERYCALQRVGASPIMPQYSSALEKDGNIKIGFMRYSGRIDIDNHVIYRRY